jgi:hypothetical protein
MGTGRRRRAFLTVSPTGVQGLCLIENPPWLKIQSTGWLNIQSALKNQLPSGDRSQQTNGVSVNHGVN